MRRVFVFMVFVVLAGSAFAQGIDALVEARKPMIDEYRTAVQDVKLMTADHKIAMEQLKISLTRKDLGKVQTPEMSTAFYEKIRALATKQEKQIDPLQKKRKMSELKLRENSLAQKKIQLDERRKELTSQRGASK